MICDILAQSVAAEIVIQRRARGVLARSGAQPLMKA